MTTAGRRRRGDVVSLKLSGLSPEARLALLEAGNMSEFIRQALEARVAGGGLQESLESLARIEAAVAVLGERLSRLESGCFRPTAPADPQDRKGPSRQRQALLAWAADDD